MRSGIAEIRLLSAWGLLFLGVLLPFPALPAGDFEETTHPLLRWYALALTRNPELLRLEDQRKAQSALIPSLSALPNPRLTTLMENSSLERITIRRDPMSRIGVMVDQRFPLGGKLGLWGKEGELEERMIELGILIARGELFLELSRLYGELYEIEERLGLLEKLEGALSALKASILGRYRSGALANGLNEVELIRSGFLIERRRLEAEREGLKSRLVRLVGGDLPGVGTIPPPPFDLGIPATLPPYEASPLAQRARVAVELARIRRTLVGRDPIPDLEVGVGVMGRGGAFPPMGTLRLSAELPVFFFQKESARILAEEYRVRAVEEEERGLILEIGEIITKTEEQLRFLKGVLPGYEQTVEEVARRFESRIVTEYARGGRDLGDLLLELKILYEGSERLFSLRRENLVAQAQIIALFPFLLENKEDHREEN
jgi:outer membrane protein TolC